MSEIKVIPILYLPDRLKRKTKKILYLWKHTCLRFKQAKIKSDTIICFINTISTVMKL